MRRPIPLAVALSSCRSRSASISPTSTLCVPISPFAWHRVDAGLSLCSVQRRTLAYCQVFQWVGLRQLRREDWECDECRASRPSNVTLVAHETLRKPSVQARAPACCRDVEISRNDVNNRRKTSSQQPFSTVQSCQNDERSTELNLAS